MELAPYLGLCLFFFLIYSFFKFIQASKRINSVKDGESIYEFQKRLLNISYLFWALFFAVAFFTSSKGDPEGRVFALIFGVGPALIYRCYLYAMGAFVKK